MKLLILIINFSFLEKLRTESYKAQFIKIKLLVELKKSTKFNVELGFVFLVNI